MKKVQDKHDKERAIALMRQARLYEEKFYQEKSKYFDVELHKNGICVVVLKSLDEYREEGTAMHHCVFTNGYYKLSNTLILSARDTDGNRLATIELSLNNYKVLQCRSVCNGIPKQYDEIVALVEQNAKKFRHCA